MTMDKAKQLRELADQIEGGEEQLNHVVTMELIPCGFDSAWQAEVTVGGIGMDVCGEVTIEAKAKTPAAAWVAAVLRAKAWEIEHG